MFEIIPSIASADPLNLGGALQSLAGFPCLHLDIEDGNFTPNITFGLKTAAAVAAAWGKPLDAHLMANHPQRYFVALAGMGVSSVAVHYESVDYPLEALHAVRSLGMKAGLAVNFKTGWRDVLPFAGSFDYVLVMTAEPDGAGERFCPAMLEKIRELRNHLPFGTSIRADGGIGDEECPLVLEAGADTLIMGRYLFACAGPRAAADALVQKYGK